MVKQARRRSSWDRASEFAAITDGNPHQAKAGTVQ
jgi:hypothetical protein